jgi:hypothetical protein
VSVGFEFQGRELHEVLFPADVAGLHSPEQVAIELALVVYDLAGNPLELVRLDLQRRQRDHPAVEVWGTALGGVLQVHVRGTASGAWTVEMSTADQDLDAVQAANLLRLVDVVRPPNGVSLQRPGAPGLIERITRPAAAPPPAGLPEAVEALARLQEHLGVRIGLPEAFGAAAMRDIAVAGALLAGQTVRDRWSERDLQVTAALVRRLRDEHGPHGVLVELPEQWVVELEDSQYTLPITVTYRQLRVVTWPSLIGVSEGEGVQLTVVPGDNDSMELRLRTDAGREPAPDPLVDVPDPVIEVAPAEFERLLLLLDDYPEPVPGLAAAAARLTAARLASARILD